MKYAFGKAVQMSQQQAIDRVTQELAKEGFATIAGEVRSRLERVLAAL